MPLGHLKEFSLVQDISSILSFDLSSEAVLDLSHAELIIEDVLD
jgi:hypothetical protein